MQNTSSTFNQILSQRYGFLTFIFAVATIWLKSKYSCRSRKYCLFTKVFLISFLWTIKKALSKIYANEGRNLFVLINVLLLEPDSVSGMLEELKNERGKKREGERQRQRRRQRQRQRPRYHLTTMASDGLLTWEPEVFMDRLSLSNNRCWPHQNIV